MTLILRKIVLIFLFCSLSFVNLFASNIDVDSLYKEAFYADSAATVIALASDFERICSSIEDFRCLKKLYFLIGYRSRYEYKPSQSFNYYHKCFDLAERFEDYRYQKSVMLNISALFSSIGDFSNAANYKLRALKYSEELGLENNVATYLRDIGEYLRCQGKMDSAAYYLEQSYFKEKELGNLEGQALVLNTLGLCAYDVMDYQDALDYYDMALDKADTSKKIKCKIYTNKGLIALKNGKLSQAKYLLESAIKIKKNLGKGENELIPQFNFLGEIYLRSEEYDSALMTFTKALFLNNYNGLHGANTEQFYVSMGFLEEIQDTLEDEELLARLGVTHKHEEFLRWQSKNQLELDKLNAALEVQLKSEKVIRQQQESDWNKKILLLIVALTIILIAVWQLKSQLKKRKKARLLKKIESFDQEFEEKYESLR